MSKNPNERNRMPDEGEDFDREKQGESKEGQKGKNKQDWNKGQQQQHRQEPIGQGHQGEPQKEMDPNKVRKPGGPTGGGTDEETDERSKRPA